jgi:hypothetical protein
MTAAGHPAGWPRSEGWARAAAKQSPRPPNYPGRKELHG